MDAYQVQKISSVVNKYAGGMNFLLSSILRSWPKSLDICCAIKKMKKMKRPCVLRKTRRKSRRHDSRCPSWDSPSKLSNSRSVKKGGKEKKKKELMYGKKNCLCLYSHPKELPDILRALDHFQCRRLGHHSLHALAIFPGNQARGDWDARSVRLIRRVRHCGSGKRSHAATW